MNHYTIEITVDGQRRYEVWMGTDATNAKMAVCDSLNMVYGSGNDRWYVGRATKSTEAEIEMDRRLTEMATAA